MSQLTESFNQFASVFKDNVADVATDAIKNQIVAWVKTTGLPGLKSMADAYSDTLKASSEGKVGWIKFRDAIFLPGLISFGLWLATMSTDILIKQLDIKVD